MREKEQQSEQLQKDKETLLSQIAHLRSQLDTMPSDHLHSDSSSSQSEYDQFLSQLHKTLSRKTKALPEFLKFITNISHLMILNNAVLDPESILAQIDSASSSNTSENFKRNASLSNKSSTLVDSLKTLLQSTELQQFNTQIVTYMGEQLIHKAALNGYLKFTCDLLRKKLVI